MSERGVNRSDPEFLKGTQLLQSFHHHQQYLSQQHQYNFQQKRQAQAQAQALGNGATHARQPSETHHHPSINTAIPASSVSAPGNSPSVESSTTEHINQEQLNLLKSQLFAFKSLSKNNRIPPQFQTAIFSQRQKRQAVAIEQALRSSTADGELPAGITTEDIYRHVYAGLNANFRDPSSDQIAYHLHGFRETRPYLPGLLPEGIDYRAARLTYEEARQRKYESELILYKRMSDRYEHLKSLPGNLAHWDAAAEDPKVDTSQRLKAVIQLKALGLYARQKELRDKVGMQMMAYDNIATTLNRSSYRRTKKQAVREARITEKLEKQQRDARETREKKRHESFMHAIHTRCKEVRDDAELRRRRGKKLCASVQTHHANMEKEEQKRVERLAKQRLQLLKANNEEDYLKLVDEAKDTRITHLLRQTNKFLSQLTSSVMEQQRANSGSITARAAAGDDQGEDEADESEDEIDEASASKIDYYAVAHRVKEEVTAQASILVGGTLKEYQIKGLQWMLSLYNNNLNGILADEMGLGKTIQTISLITYLVEKKQQAGPYLVIVPLSTLTNWNLEFDKWAPSLTKIVYKGPPNARKVQQEKLRQGFNVLLTTFEYIIKDRPLLSRIKWFHMIIDEGHRMKNNNSKLSATIQQYYSTRFRLILTGTPLQNNLTELWAILNFVLPTIFKSSKTFEEWFNTPFANTGDSNQMQLTEEEKILVIRRLHKVLRPFLLRRLKKDVEKDLPDKTEKVIKCKFSSLQSRLYKQMVTHNKLVVSDGKGGKTNARGLSNMIMQLRKLCNHPFVFDEVENQMNPMSISNDLLWRTCGKFELLDRILPKYKASGHRILMFFQMTAIMDIMEDYLRYRDYKFLRLDGMTKSDERADMLRDFNHPESEYFMFLLSTRAGGLGLNLQTADTVIIYDSDWNPHQDLQAQDRAHRIGQKNEVRILRLISSNSVEEKILERARYKLDMDGKVIQAGRFDNKSSETDRDAMLRTLLETADMTESGDQDEMDDDELNMILARSDDEVAQFQRMDEERDKDPVYGTRPGCRAKPRLMGEDELPDIYLDEGNPEAVLETEESLGRGARERTKVKYDDGLTEEQWLNAVDDDEDSPEAAAARKQARKDRRENNRMRKVAAVNAASQSPAPTRAASVLDDGVNGAATAAAAGAGAEATPKKRGRKPGKAEKRKASGDDGAAADEVDEEQPPAKKRRGAMGKAKAVGVGGGAAAAAAAAAAASKPSPQQREVLQKRLRELHDALMTLEVDDPEPPEEEDEDESPGPYKRLIIGPFVKLPPKKDYADYYVIIREPVCMNMIQTRIKKNDYSALSDMKRDFDTMVRNCQTYNEDTSLLYQDSQVMQVSGGQSWWR
jgi:ATP-dependent helicase STH1/SNF2